MATLLTAPNAELALFRAYDGERRLRLTRIVAPLFGIVTLLCLIGLIFYLVTASVHQMTLATGALPPETGYFAMGILGVVVLLYGISTYGAYHGQVRLATWTSAAAVFTATMVVGSLWEFSQGLGPFGFAGYVLFPLDIVLIGLLTGGFLTILATLAMNGITILFTLFAPREMGIGGLVNHEATLVIFFCILLEWCFTILMLAQRQTMRVTLRELGDTRVAYERAQKLDAIKDQFIRNVNHELRNPMMALNGYVKVLRQQHEILPPERQKAFLDRACQVSDRVVALLKSILDTGRLEQNAGDFTASDVPLQEVVLEAAQLLDPLEKNFAERELHLAIAPDLRIWGDRVRLQQVMTNLLSNAVKYSPAGTLVTVQASIVQEAGPASHRPWARTAPHRSMVEITVRDLGLGVPVDQMPLLFQRFVRLPRDLTSSITGNGLGLFICRQLVEAMDGSIWVESAGIEGEGSAFHLRLPVSDGQVATPHSTA